MRIGHFWRALCEDRPFLARLMWGSAIFGGAKNGRSSHKKRKKAYTKVYKTVKSFVTDEYERNPNNRLTACYFSGFKWICEALLGLQSLKWLKSRWQYYNLLSKILYYTILYYTSGAYHWNAVCWSDIKYVAYSTYSPPMYNYATVQANNTRLRKKVNISDIKNKKIKK